jgi:hypothetical protein
VEHPLLVVALQRRRRTKVEAATGMQDEATVTTVVAAETTTAAVAAVMAETTTARAEVSTIEEPAAHSSGSVMSCRILAAVDSEVAASTSIRRRAENLDLDVLPTTIRRRK